MDTLLESLWRTGQKPFHDQTLVPTGKVLVSDAVIAISSALGHIGSYYPSHRLFSFDDWHEHDGFVTSAKPVGIEELREQVGNPASYVSHLSDDDVVYRTIYPDSLDFVLRYGFFGDDSLEASAQEAHWTFTGYGHDIAELKKRWQCFGMSIENSSDFFLSRHSG